MVQALELLYALGGLDQYGRLTDPMGVRMAEFPLSPMFAKMLLESGNFGCSKEIVTIAAMMQIQNIFMVPANQKKPAVSVADVVMLNAQSKMFCCADLYVCLCPSRLQSFYLCLRSTASTILITSRLPLCLHVSPSLFLSLLPSSSLLHRRVSIASLLWRKEIISPCSMCTKPSSRWALPL